MLYLDNSQVEAFQNCEQFYYWRYIKHLTPKQEKDAFTVGKIIHQGLSMLLKNEDPLPLIETAILPTTKVYYEKQNIFNLLSNFDKERHKIISEGEILTDVLVDRKIKKDAIYYGNLDSLIQRNNYTDLSIIEFKTTSSITQPFCDSFNLSSQIIGYNWILTPQTYSRQINTYVVLLNLKNAEIKILPIYIDKNILDSFRLYLIKLSTYIETKQRDKRNFIQNLTACRGTFPSWQKCQYLPICFLDDNKKLSIVKKLLYKKEVWTYERTNKNTMPSMR